MKNLKRFATLWGAAYQGESDPEKMDLFVQHAEDMYGMSPHESELQLYCGLAAEAFHEDIGMPLKEMAKLLYATALHESLGGRYLEQVGGPARGWWQVEPATARDILVNSSVLLGPKAHSLLLATADLDKKVLSTMSDRLLAAVLKLPQVCVMFAAAKYVQAIQNNPNLLEKVE